ncbi:hypothetical protein Afil01_50740 [Actinorhabdospora filicis]|uniref:Protein kinase domain-containing protein n=1 Tax=Actinorhabdospora filicis TaxID=1785913 RepID=A0A9W6SQZ9_9ACTN|nr:hypothetical protein [Actinorhabdospora filicis]GLZ80267.1 hypothetical protein Afil01_50740 [Actinorhabdospora filicis]
MTAPLHRDATASVHALPGPALRILGERPVSGAALAAWRMAVTALSGTPGLVAVRSIGVDGRGHTDLVVDASGATLAEALVGSGPLSPGAAVAVFAQVAAGLAAWHGAGLRHGAVSPSTVVIAPDGRAWLAGLDASAPGLELAAVPNRYLAPEGAAGPPSDVYSLAVSVFVALGGTVPYEANPADPALRRLTPPELPGVPAGLMGLLREAMHPDPARRPSAGTFAATLSGLAIPVTATVAAPLAAGAVGAPVRPANDRVVSINLAVSGAALAGGAAAAGVIAGQALGGALQGSGSAGAAAKAGTGLALKITVGAVATAIAAAAVVAAVNWPGGTAENPGTAAGGPSPATSTATDGIRGFDIQNADFVPGYTHGLATGLAPTKFRDGSATAQAKDPSLGYSLGFEIAGAPMYGDFDTDGDLDAAVMIRAIADGGQRALFFWEWRDGAVRQVPYMAFMETPCEYFVDDGFPVVKDNAVEIAARRSTDCDFATTSWSGTVHYGLKNGFPVQLSPGTGAAGFCFHEAGTDLVGKVTPLLGPDPAAPPLTGQYTHIELSQVAPGEPGSDYEGWNLARLTAVDGSVSCGWIPPGTVS